LHVRVSLPQLPQDPEADPLHGQTPFVHVTPAAHAWPHDPQLPLSVWKLTQALPHVL
jgi:hypothetical protein